MTLQPAAPTVLTAGPFLPVLTGRQRTAPPRVCKGIEPGNPKHFLVVLLYGLAMLATGLLIWLGPVAYGLIQLRADNTTLGIVVTAAGAVWALLLAVDRTVVGMLASAVHSILIFARLVEDPWEGER